MASMQNNLHTSFCGMSLNSPIILLSGCVGFGEEYTRIKGFSNTEVGAVCLKGTTLEPRLGNKPHRIAETANGMLNSIGLQNPGTEIVIDEIMPSLKKNETKFIINISGSSVEEYGEIAKHFDDTDIDAVEINISCPNVKEGGVAFGNDPEMSFRVVEICRKNTTKPIITKLSPNQTDIAKNAARCIDAGSDGLAVINTVTGMAVDIETRKPVIGNNRGGLSGPSIKPIALLKVHQVYQVSKKYNIPIIGQGGITSANDALEFIIAGAATIGVGTALFYDPLVCEKINTGISQHLSDQNLSGVGSLVGTLQLN
ncbi:MAG TPA: dihydroorotate dehydrogenase [Gammaproteobacteria bacterium]|nr:dihydroorotate dehydrogenase [Gammaproteobacteria bacterium]